MAAYPGTQGLFLFWPPRGSAWPGTIVVAAMITSCARIMAVATIATTRCGSFLYGGSRSARAGARGGKQFAALHLSSTQVEHGTGSTALSRGNADDASLDSSLISTNPELVVEHMKARRMGKDSVEAVNRIGGELLAPTLHCCVSSTPCMNSRYTCAFGADLRKCGAVSLQPATRSFQL